MNKKYNLLLAALIFLLPSMIFAAQVAESNLELYNRIILAVQQNSWNSANIDLDRAIVIVEEHKKKLETKRDEKKAIFETSYAPMLFKIAGSLLLFPTIVGGAATVVGGGGSYLMFRNAQQEASSYRMPPSYFEFVRELYGSVLPQIFFSSGRIAPEDLNTSKKFQAAKGIFAGEYNSGRNTVLALGMLAPLIASASLGLGLISRYLFNKGASYKKEILQLEDEIDVADGILKILQRWKDKPTSSSQE